VFESEARKMGLSSPSTESMIRQINRIETGRTRIPAEFYQRLFCAAYGKTAADLFGEPETQQLRAAEDGFVITSHKFVPIYVGPAVVSDLDALRPLAWGSAKENRAVTVLDCPLGDCDLHVFPFGVALFHVREEVTFPTVAALAIWRRNSYAAALDWATSECRALIGSREDRYGLSEYVLSLYCLKESIWPTEQLDTAMRLLSAPSTLLSSDNLAGVDELRFAELAERSAFRNGFERRDLISFGVKGVSVGYASWSGVSYYALAAARSLPSAELVETELQVQSLWCYCSHILASVEAGNDPVAVSGYGRRYLRASRLRLASARPQETGQHCLMRDAILESSGLTKLLEEAQTVLPDDAMAGDRT
jgi:hypothetical protein